MIVALLNVAVLLVTLASALAVYQTIRLRRRLGVPFGTSAYWVLALHAVVLATTSLAIVARLRGR